METAGAVCAVHPQVPASESCDRCGNYVCVTCRVPEGLEHTLCSTCSARLRNEDERPTGKIHRALRVLFYVGIVTTLASCVSSALQLELLDRVTAGDYTDAELTSNDLRESLVGGLDFFVFLVTAVLFIIWQRRTNRNARLRGAGLDYGPNAWGWFAAPLFNLWKPYEAIKELYTSATGELTVPGRFRLWWGLWLINNFVGNQSLRMLLRDDGGVDSLVSSTWLTLINTGLHAPLCLAALAVVDAIQRVNERPEQAIAPALAGAPGAAGVLGAPPE